MHALECQNLVAAYPPPSEKQEIWCGLMKKIADFLEILARPDEKIRKFWLRQIYIGGTLVNKTQKSAGYAGLMKGGSWG